jgi:hypothetical protein
MASTSGTTIFNLDLSELVEEAFERCGSQLRSGYDLRTARRSLNLMSIEWANRGINLWTVEECSIPLVTNQGIYNIPADTIDILDLETRTSNASTSNQTDINLSRISESTYATIPNKLTTGRPVQVYYNRQSGNEDTSTTIYLAANITATDTTITLATTDGSVVNLRSTGYIKIDNETIAYTNLVGNVLNNCWRGQNGTTAVAHTAGTNPNYTYITIQYLPCVNVWPTPDSGGGPYTLVYWRMRRVQDAGTGVNIQDVPFRFINCMAAGLAYFLSIKIQGITAERVMFLKQDYEDQFNLASQEDRETAPIRWVPRNLFYSR